MTRFLASLIITVVRGIAGRERKMRLGLVLVLLPALLLPAGAAERPVATTDNQSEIDIAFWKSVEGSKDRNELEAYLNRFPSGIFAELARLRLARMRAPSIEILPGPEPAPQPPAQRPPAATIPFNSPLPQPPPPVRPAPVAPTPVTVVRPPAQSGSPAPPPPSGPQTAPSVQPGPLPSAIRSDGAWLP